MIETTHTLRGEGFDASEDGTGRGTPLVPVVTDTLTSNGDAHSGFRDEKGLVPVAYIGGIDYENNGHEMDEPTGPLLKGSPTGGGHPLPAVATTMQVRRLTPTECERLQGFPDGYTDIKPKGKPTPDGSRYKALGNSMAVPVMRWIGQRIDNAIYWEFF